MKKLWFFAVLLLFWGATALQAQEDFNFAQYHNTPFINSPAMIANQEHIAFTLNYRNQPNATGEGFRTAIASIIHPFLKRCSEERFGALGLAVLNDRPGEFLSNNGIMLTYAHRFRIANPTPKRQLQHFVNVGLQAGYFQRGVNLNGLTTDSQFNGGIFDPNAASGESFSSEYRGYTVITPSVMWFMNDAQGRQKAYLGVSVFNINRPQTSFYNDITDVLPHHWTIIGGAEVFSNDRLALIPTFRWINRSGSDELTTGLFGKYKINGAANNPLVKAGNVNAGLWYNHNQAFVACVEWEQPQYTVALNMDLPTSQNSRNWQGRSTFEFTIAVRLFKKMKRCPLTNADPIDMAPYVERPVNVSNKLPMLNIPEQPMLMKERARKLQQGVFRFKTGSAELDETSTELLDEVAEIMLDFTDATIEIEAHTDNVGSRAGNIALSKKRAEALRALVLQKYPGIDPNRIKISWHGPDKPVAPNDTEANRYLNRRVEFRVTYPD
ncbi:PorP/SprF family type IX secretion system membrane protein [Eisenibacter elegans]|uniref:PorP/SprF family type IX secretion system membrane protein n=1 Tax=Eisenibacter elegans TaxID=997 RepID=UPI000686BBD2|nr:PorP/SprF family type IX secretion system membrane protein [Eisenibacter elegans]